MAELKALLDSRTIEPVNASHWISNLAIAIKKSGGLHICVDLCAVSIAIIPDKYPFLTMEKLTTHMELHSGPPVQML